MQLNAFDTFYPYNFGAATVQINVIRNPATPIFSAPNYVQTVNENYPLGDVVIDVNATDSDGVSVSVKSHLNTSYSINYEQIV